LCVAKTQSWGTKIKMERPARGSATRRNQRMRRTCADAVLQCHSVYLGNRERQRLSSGLESADHGHWAARGNVFEQKPEEKKTSRLTSGRVARHRERTRRNRAQTLLTMTIHAQWHERGSARRVEQGQQCACRSCAGEFKNKKQSTPRTCTSVRSQCAPHKRQEPQQPHQGNDVRAFKPT
jgi:hypothetical protein